MRKLMYTFNISLYYLLAKLPVFTSFEELEFFEVKYFILQISVIWDYD